MTRLLVIRHAATEWNAAGRIQGRADPSLSTSGRAEAGSWRLPDGWERAVALASPLRRARETAQLIGLDPLSEARLIEMDWGAWEGERLGDLRGRLGAAMAENEAKGLDFRPPGGESPRDVQDRLRPLLTGMTGPTIWVTHKGVLRALHALAAGWTMQGKAPHKLLDGHAHAFGIAAGAPRVEALNIALSRAG